MVIHSSGRERLLLKAPEAIGVGERACGKILTATSRCRRASPARYSSRTARAQPGEDFVRSWLLARADYKAQIVAQLFRVIQQAESLVGIEQSSAESLKFSNGASAGLRV